jgi:hypothetical protein
MKDDLESQTFQSFVQDFDVTVMSRQLLQRLGDSFVRFDYKINLVYRPTNKAMITYYDEIYLVEEPNKSPCKHKLITRLANDALNLTYTLQHKKELIAGHLMSYSTMIEYKNEIFKLRKVLGSDLKFQRFLKCYVRNP